MTESYHFQIQPEPRAGLRPGEFILAADGGLHRRTHWDYFVVLSANDVRLNGWNDGESLARHLESLGYTRRDSIAFPSGACILTSGDKIVGRIEPAGDDYDEGDNWREPLRAPLPHFNQRTKHDPFGDGFTVTKGAVEVTPTPSSTTDSAYPAIAGLLRG